ncbi:response regulator [Gloeothece verrucosa]|uniref:Response regulator receiver protein n=1 Tax=Gloeothece verrucosa (strain PCC 7822) TaxID=497965 RepID=E0ULC0_GLOV7|nr:response regulator [Gloeothece verrucosa]ADN17750.1 response regulator receiver protein [Gloeothece verrucosa PCC 7822]
MKKILVVEDDLRFQRNYRRGCRQELEQGLFEFEFTPSGEQGLEALKKDTEKEIVLIILDLKMDLAQINGLQFLTEVSHSNINRPIICYTAYPEKIENLSSEDLSRVVCVLPKGQNQYQFKVLRDLMVFLLSETVFQSVVTEANKELLDYPQVKEVVKHFSDRKKLKLIKELVADLSYPYMKEFYREVPSMAKALIDSVQQQNQKILRKWVLEKLEEKLLPSEIPTDECVIYRIEESIRGSTEKGKYYYLKWFDKNTKKDRSKYIPQTIAASLPPEFRSP